MSNTNTGTIFCAACGNPVIATAFICPKCGTKIVRPGSGTREIQVYETKPKKEYREYKAKERVIYVVLALFFGGFGIHNFYAERNVPAVIQLILGITFIGLLVTIIWAVIDAITVDTDGKGQPFV